MRPWRQGDIKSEARGGSIFLRSQVIAYPGPRESIKTYRERALKPKRTRLICATHYRFLSPPTCQAQDASKHLEMTEESDRRAEAS